MSDPKNARERTDAAPDTDADPHGRDHSEGLSGAKTREGVDRDERFANSRDDGVVDEHNYLDDVGEAVASTLGSVAGVGKETDEKIDDEQHGRDPKTGARRGGAPRDGDAS